MIFDGSSWVWWLLVLCIGALGGYIAGTRARINLTGGHCEVDTHWFFGWWVRCRGDCPNGQECKLLWRRKGEERWGDPGVVPGGSVKWSEGMEYKCECRAPAG